MYREAIGTIAKRDSNNVSSDTERRISSWIDIYRQHHLDRESLAEARMESKGPTWRSLWNKYSSLLS